MSDETTVEAEETGAEVPAEPAGDAPEEPTGEGDGSPDIEKVRREAAGHRRKLRETEAERDALGERLTVLQRSEAARIATTALHDGDDLLRERELSSLLDEAGNVDAERVRAAAHEIAEAHPHWRKRHGESDAGKGRASTPAGTSFGQALKGAA